MLEHEKRDDHTFAGTITELNVYPVKSMKGIALRSWPLAANGLLFDRRWMVVDASGAQVTQREAPKLCLITPTLLPPASDGSRPHAYDPDANDLDVNDPDANDPAAKHLVLSAPGAGSVVIPVDAPGAPRTVRVWDDSAAAITGSPEVDAWLSEFLGRDVQLVRFAAVEATEGRLWQRQAFPDSLPFLLIGQGSLDDINSRLLAKGESTVEMARFRPNFVVAGPAPFAEDGWRQLKIGELRFSVERPCARCMITTIDQSTASVGREPLKTLARYRTAYHDQELEQGTNKQGTNKQGADRRPASGRRREIRGVIFGQKLIHHDLGSPAVGDRVTVLETLPEADRLQFVPEVAGKPRR